MIRCSLAVEMEMTRKEKKKKKKKKRRRRENERKKANWARRKWKEAMECSRKNAIFFKSIQSRQSAGKQSERVHRDP